MKRILWAAAIAAAVLTGCDPKKPPNPPAPKTAADAAMQAVAAATPASDPSLPPASIVSEADTKAAGS